MRVVNKTHKLKIKALSIILAAITLISSFYAISSATGAVTPQSANPVPAIGATEANVSFTGNVAKDFAGHLIYVNDNASSWGSGNNISALYVSFNSSYLFVGVQETISDNGLMVVISNETNSSQGTTNITNLNAWQRSIVFSSPINEFSAVWYGGSGNTQASGNSSYQITSKITASNSTPYAVQIRSLWDISSIYNSTEIAIPLQSIFSNNSGTESIGIAALLIGGSSSWVGTAIPYDQTGPYSKGSTYFVVSEELKINNITYNQKTPTVGKYYGNIQFTGNVSNDFSGHLIYYNYNSSKWGNTNNISDMYFAYNSTTLFFGFKEDILGNSLLLAMSNNTNSGLGTYNFSSLNTWSRNISFVDPVNYFSAVYFSGSGQTSGNNSFIINSKQSDSNTASQATIVRSTWDFNVSNLTTEISIPVNQILSPGTSSLNLSVAALVIGGSGSWVGTGIPYDQQGPYSTGNVYFVVNSTINLNITGLKVTSTVHAPYNPINLAIIFNDHQPLYTVVNSSDYNLPWTEVHATAEYIEQALIAHDYNVNITYQLSGSLLYQLQNISADPNYNNTVIQYSYLPYSQVIENKSLYNTIVGYYFSIPGYVFSLSEPASMLYNHIRNMWLSGQILNESYYEDAKVLWFLFDISTPLVEGQLGRQWINSTIWSMHNQTSFSQNDLNEILAYSKWLTGQVINAFKNDSMNSQNGSRNVELFTSPMFHPLVPLLLANNISGPSGTIYKQSYYTDLLAQLNISLGQFHSMFGFWPSGIYSPEAAFSYGMVQPYASEGGQWTASAEWTLQQSGVNALAYGNAGSNVTTMENLYRPYLVSGQNNSSIYVFFRDGYLSNAWGFNYGSMGTAAAVSAFMNYLKGIYAEIPAQDHNGTVVTVMLDGENWMFMSPFAMDGVPFLQQLYSALEQNSSYVRTVTPSQYIQFMKSNNMTAPVIAHVATGSWNRGTGSAAPYQSNPSLEQWSGYQVQDFYWVALNFVRQEVLNYGNSHGIQQVINYTTMEEYLKTNDIMGNYSRAWFGIYADEGSDWFFTTAPWDISGSNTAPFDYIFKHNLIYSLDQLGIPVPQFLLNNSYPSIAPTVTGNMNASHTPQLTGYQQAVQGTNYGNAFSITNNNTWSGATIYTSNSQYIRNLSIAYDPSNLYLEIQTTFNPQYLLVNRNMNLDVYISAANPELPASVANDNPFAIYAALQGNYALGFPASYVAEFNPYTFQSGSLSGEYSLYAATGLNTLEFQSQDVNTPVVIGNVIQLAIPLTYLQLYPGQSFKIGLEIYNGTNGNSMLSPISVSLPTSLATFYPISSIHNTVPPNGPGNYTYPDQPGQIPPGSLDLKWVNVSMNSNFVKWNFTYGQLWNIWGGPIGFSNQIISVYVSQKNLPGATYLGAGPNANSSAPWQSMIYISGWAIYVQNYKGDQYTNGISSSVNYTTGNISVSIPLSYIGYNIEDYSYIIISGSYDGYGVNGWRIVDAVNTTNGGWQGGGGDPPWSSNIYAYIAPATVGEGNITQQSALQYAPHQLATLYPISLPLLKNSTVSAVQFNYSNYTNLNLLKVGDQYFELFISNRTGVNNMYLAESSDGKIWNYQGMVAGTNGISQVSVTSSGNIISGAEIIGGTIYIIQLNPASGAIKVLKSINHYYGKIGNVFSGQGNQIFMTFYSGPNAGKLYQYTLLMYNVTSGTLNSYIIGNGTSGINGAFYNGREYLIYYNGSSVDGFVAAKGSVEPFKVNGNFTGIEGNFSISVNSYGNLWISYISLESNQFYLKLANLTLNGSFIIYKHYTIVSSSSPILESSILLSQSGSNYTVFISWLQKGQTEYSVWELKSGISFTETPIITKTAPTPSYLYYYITGIVVVIILLLLLAIYVTRKRKI